MDAPLFAGCLLLAVLCLLAERRWGTPFAVFFGFWATIFLARILLPMGLTETSGEAAAIVGAGLAATFTGLLATSPLATSRPLSGPHGIELAAVEKRHRVPLIARTRIGPFSWRVRRRLVLVAGAMLAAILVGLWQYRFELAERAGSTFGSLTRQQVLYYQIYENTGSSPILLLLSLCSVLAGLGVVLGRIHPLGYVLVPIALVCSMQSPSRTGTITTAGLVLIMYPYLGAPTAGRPKNLLHKAGLFALVGLFCTLTIIYFNAEGEALRKETGPLPGVPTELEFLTGPLTYATGNLSALSVAVASPDVPYGTDSLRSIWLVPRALSAVLPTVEVPDPIAGYVPIPDGYNTYSMFGDLYFDFGMTGVVAGSFATGVLTGWWHRRAVTEPTPFNAWVAAVFIVVLFGGVTGFRLLWLDTATWLAAGAAIFHWSGQPDTIPHAGRSLP